MRGFGGSFVVVLFPNQVKTCTSKKGILFALKDPPSLTLFFKRKNQKNLIFFHYFTVHSCISVASNKEKVPFFFIFFFASNS